jgi:hypothetical protein
MRFRVALSFVEKIIKQWRETGGVSPKPHGEGQKLKPTFSRLFKTKNNIAEKRNQGRAKSNSVYA